MALTPMLQQYKDLKEQYKDCLLFDRVGDFYEMYFEDALIGSRDMDVVLTKKSCGEEEKAPMCGVPYHSVETYIARLLEHGHKVAIAEQMEDPALAKGLVKRQVIRVVTPGTVIDPNMLREKDNNFLAAVYVSGSDFGLCWVDISTGEFFAMQQTSDRT
ncbi:MAG: DNA mismatch repair protein MutS, partial [Firmicutes bacterium]|nr:DNA mismatch repair protein MutS [Bacillota bacterium]